MPSLLVNCGQNYLKSLLITENHQFYSTSKLNIDFLDAKLSSKPEIIPERLSGTLE